MSRLRPARAAALAAALGLSWAPPARAVRPITPPAPEFPSGAAWINSRPFSMRHLKGRRVVLITFINLYSANSTRTLPWLNKLWDQYSLKGLMIIGIHAPDYEFDRDPVEVRSEAARQAVRFPIFVDSGKKMWEAYRNDGWPAHYLIDHRGLVVHDQLGEGGYSDFEREILLALDRKGWSAPKDYAIAPDKPRQDCGEATPAFYLGARRGKKPVKIQALAVEAITRSRDGEVAVLGNWNSEMELLRFSGDKRRLETRMRIIYQAAEALAVLARLGKRPGRIYLKQDGAWLHSGNASADVQWDDDDRSFVLVDHPRLYSLTRNRKRVLNELELFPDEEGLGVAGFEFSNYCQTELDKK